MGFNFIYSQAKTHTKAWNDKFTQGANDLFAGATNPIERTFIAKSPNCAEMKEGEWVHVRRKDTDIVVYRGLNPIAAAQAPSLALFEMVDSGHGVIQGRVMEVIAEANLVVVKVVEQPSND